MNNEYYIAIRKVEFKDDKEYGKEIYDEATLHINKFVCKDLANVLDRKSKSTFQFYPVIRIAKVRIEEIDD